ncbi:MAG: 5'/3'-nucleotidase SurE [Gammaproteobacteria bacterium]|nr:5'/3'-nucleotidase SurE [Gammaproteobacteria bacterium]
MRILISNDDGVHAPGLLALVDELSKVAELDVLVPDRNKSGASSSLTLGYPLRPQILRNGFICLDGTPTDCVHLALSGYLQHKPDLIVSGINSGPNLGEDTIYSGTVAAAIEAYFFGIPSIAMSLDCHGDGHFDTAAKVARQLVERFSKNALNPTSLLNVNVPNVPFAKLQGIEVVRLGRRHTANNVVHGKDGRGQLIYWTGPATDGKDAGVGTDFYALEHNKVAITPLQLDLTNYAAFDDISKWGEDLIR